MPEAAAVPTGAELNAGDPGGSVDVVLRLDPVPRQAFCLEILLDLEGLSELESHSSFFCFFSKLPVHT